MSYTITDLRETIVDCNFRLERAGSSIRFEEQGRNGYEAVDEYSVPRKDGCVNRTVECGTSRQCGDATESAMYQELARINYPDHPLNEELGETVARIADTLTGVEFKDKTLIEKDRIQTDLTRALNIIQGKGS